VSTTGAGTNAIARDAIGPLLTASHDGLAEGGARSIRVLSRGFGLGAGTSAPGLFVERIAPGFVARRSARLRDGVVLVSGTNGKTTTAAMIASILSAQGLDVVTNASGANLFRGIAGALAVAPRSASAGVFEVDEGALERVVRATRPRMLVLTNVFRDQLDRFGEPEMVAKALTGAAQVLPPGAVILANADDPLLWPSVEHLSPSGFGVRGHRGRTQSIDGEPELCARCGSSLEYLERTFAHLGQARCSRCSWRSTTPGLTVEIRDCSGLERLGITTGGCEILLRIGGVHNAYNTAASLAAASALGIPPTLAIQPLQTFRPPFGRTERLEFEGTRFLLVLMKNPAGAGAVIDQILGERDIATVVVMVSDQWSDGRDVSWIWDADFESLARSGLPVVTGGRRAADAAVRLKYAGSVPRAVLPNVVGALRRACRIAPIGGTVAILATYSAMLDVRAAIFASRVGRMAPVTG